MTPAPLAPPVAEVDPLNDPKGNLSKRSVYFPYKIDAIQNAYVSLLKAHGNYLGKHPERKVRVEGNCDERGSNEYNLALGQRRANNTRQSLIDNGATSGQISAVSYGEDRPRSHERTEAGWAENRRADLNYNP
jgi:peptidoglycan-associated lipoprotein